MIASRENKEKSIHNNWYSVCYDQVIAVFNQLNATTITTTNHHHLSYSSQILKSDKLHREEYLYGAFLILNELLRFSNIKYEKLRQEADEYSQTNLILDIPSSSKYSLFFKEWSAHSFSKGLKSLSLTSYSLTTNSFLYKNSTLIKLNKNFGLLSSSSLYNRKIALCESSICKILIKSKFDELCNVTLTNYNFKNSYVQFVYFLLLPRLAAFDVDKFASIHLENTKNLVLQSFRKEKDRFQPFLPLGLIILAVKERIQPYFKEIMNILKSYLNTNKERSQTNQKKKYTIDPTFYTCVGLISKSLKQTALNEIRELIEPMIQSGISPALTNSLFEISNNVPELKKEIQEGLFKILKNVLNKQSKCNLANGLEESTTLQSDTNLILALRILSHFDFQNNSLLQFLRNCSDVHLKNENRDIRFETVKCCCKLLEHLFQKLSFENTSSNTSTATTDNNINNNFNQQQDYTASLIKTIKNVLQKLLIISISDEDPEIRYTVLASLNQKFDIELAQPENLSFLLISLKDEIFDIRELAISIVARLSSINPTFVMPKLREVTMELLTDLLYSGTGKNKEICSKILCQLIENAPRVTRPYSKMMMNSFVIVLKNNQGVNCNNNILIAILSVISSLAQVSNAEIKGHFNELYPILFDIIKDPTYSTKKKEVALSCLGKLIDSTDFEFHSYSTYNSLFECLLNLFKSEQTTSMRNKIIRVLGSLGTIDPYKHKLNIGLIDQSGDLFIVQDKKQNIESINSTELLVNKLPNYNDYYPAIAIANLVKIINDPNLNSHHTMAVQALTFIFDCLKLGCVPFISDVIPSFIAVIKSSEPTFREFLFKQLCKLVSITQCHIREFLEDIFQLIKQYWSINQETLIQLVEEIANALGDEFKIYFPRLIPYLLAIFSQDNSPDRHITRKVLVTIQKFNTQLSTYFHIILPPLIRLFDNQENSIELRRDALNTIAEISQNVDLSEEAASIMHPLIRTIDNSPELRDASMNLLCILVQQLGKMYQIFMPLVHKITKRHNILHQRYDVLVNEILRGNMWTMISNEYNQIYNQLLFSQIYNNKLDKKQMIMNNKEELNKQQQQDEIKKDQICKINLNEFNRIWNVEQNVSKEDWIDWLKDFTIILLKESPSIALRACNPLAQAYGQLSKDLFNSAFISCWNQFDEHYQKKMIELLEKILQIDNNSNIPELITTILNLVEFMEHTDNKFPINSRLLSMKAFQTRAYAKALHFIENEFRENSSCEVLEFLISVNNKLKQPDASTGILKYANAHQDQCTEIQCNWYEKLHDWENSFKAYESKVKRNPDCFESVLGQMRSLEALGEWEKLHNLSKKHWQELDEDKKSKMACLAASSAWSLGQWDHFQTYSKAIQKESSDFTFYQAVLAIHKNEFGYAQKMIDKSREAIDVYLTAMISESRERAYNTMVQAMLFSELEEVIQFKLIPERREIIKSKWWTRLQRSQKVVEDWQKILKVHSLVLTPREDRRSWLKFASISQRMGNTNLSHNTFAMLFEMSISDLNPINNDIDFSNIEVNYGYIKHLWRIGHKACAIDKLHELKENLQEEEYSVISKKVQLVDLNDHKEFSKVQHLLNKCYLKLATWKEKEEGLTEKSLPIIMSCYAEAAKRDESGYKSWHLYAYINFKALFFNKNNKKEEDNNTDLLTSTTIHNLATHAVIGFFKSISLSNGNSIQDTLRLLTVLFEDDCPQIVYDVFNENLKTVPVETWLQVIPQLIARLEMSKSNVAKVVNQILIEIGIKHPQSLIYPLSVAQKSLIEERKTAAEKVLNSMREHSSNLVNQALMVNEELIRISILLDEMCFKGLEEAYILFYHSNNENAMIKILDNLFAILAKEPVTLKELAFKNTYGRDLNQAKEYYFNWKMNKEEIFISQAWKIFYQVFQRLSYQMPNATAFDLQYVSPKLLNCKNLELSIPGSYSPVKPIIQISSLVPTLKAMSSKQRPKKLSMLGSNGQEFTFLLKGHEDLRQDERVMQLFGLVNNLLATSFETSRDNLAIQRYAVIPLSHNCGLISWVPHFDTFHNLIKNYREKKKISTNLEYQIMIKKAPNFDRLKRMQKGIVILIF